MTGLVELSWVVAAIVELDATVLLPLTTTILVTGRGAERVTSCMTVLIEEAVCDTVVDLEIMLDGATSCV